MIVAEQNDALVEALLELADLATRGYERPFTEARDRGVDDITIREAIAEAQAVAPRVLDYRNELLAETLLEAAYRCAEGRGVGAPA